MLYDWLMVTCFLVCQIDSEYACWTAKSLTIIMACGKLNYVDRYKEFCPLIETSEIASYKIDLWRNNPYRFEESFFQIKKASR